jgi:hypothetical protein
MDAISLEEINEFLEAQKGRTDMRRVRRTANRNSLTRVNRWNIVNGPERPEAARR